MAAAARRAQPGRIPGTWGPCGCGHGDGEGPGVNAGCGLSRSGTGDACGLPDGVDNGDVVLCGETGRRMLVFSCRHGFQLQGREQVACAPHGLLRPPVCRGQWLLRRRPS